MGKAGNPTGKGGFGDRPQDINRKGAPRKGNSWRAALEDAVEKIKNGDQRTKKQIIVERLIGLAMEGDLAAMKLLIERCDGLPRAIIDQNTETVIRIEEEIVE